MTPDPKVFPEHYPTDIRHVDSFKTIHFDAGCIVGNVLAQLDKLKDYNSSPEESYLLCLWLARHILTEMGYTVFDYEPNTHYQEFFDDFFEQSEKYVFIRYVERLLAAISFTPTMAQISMTNTHVHIVFGATNVHNFNTKKKDAGK